MEEQARLAEDFHIIRTLLAAEARPHVWRCVCFLHAMCAYMQEDKCLQWPSKEVITLHMHNLYVHARIRTQVSISALTTEQTRQTVR